MAASPSQEFSWLGGHEDADSETRPRGGDDDDVRHELDEGGAGGDGGEEGDRSGGAEGGRRQEEAAGVIVFCSKMAAPVGTELPKPPPLF